MDTHRHIEALAAEGRLLADAARRAGFHAPAPTRPGWTVRDLLGRTGRVHRRAAAHAASGNGGPAVEGEVARGRSPLPADEPYRVPWDRSASGPEVFSGDPRAPRPWRDPARVRRKDRPDVSKNTSTPRPPVFTCAYGVLTEVGGLG
ncbi:maleylpyruvate isomerase N-terminal domain-containing protein [Nocardiopsis lambiniae]|uniref:Maleylpyruvate isomerase N-terminal domain-containing protein n=1 Tax=Nocardiopsis lambiniae TaxID=3075539 RepID=A0ABU2MC90_9ACTN|nr:maleylpyruvate isomerase N-terminal domain-containing protein [Nocardiopsis sp. DSM 44743]MDT0330299.1 maleylpyruvate isomerase N-terminal domain-containing protein [Nocardiopsis sp. DSM 44743]